jgi:hypothetical protein
LDNEEHAKVVNGWKDEALAQAQEYEGKIREHRKELFALAIGREEYERQYAEWQADAKGYIENADR